MLHAKSQGHRPSGSGEEDFKGFLPYMGSGELKKSPYAMLIRYSCTVRVSEKKAQVVVQTSIP